MRTIDAPQLILGEGRDSAAWAGAKKREIWTTVVLRNRTKAFKVITVEEADKALAKSVSYKAPGRRWALTDGVWGSSNPLRQARNNASLRTAIRMCRHSGHRGERRLAVLPPHSLCLGDPPPPLDTPPGR